MRFIRKGGRVIPIRDNGASANSKKRYPAVKTPGTVAAVAGGVATAVLARTKFKPITAGFFGILGASAIAGSSFTKRAKGESKEHVAKRISNFSNSSKKQTPTQKGAVEGAKTFAKSVGTAAAGTGLVTGAAEIAGGSLIAKGVNSVIRSHGGSVKTVTIHAKGAAKFLAKRTAKWGAAGVIGGAAIGAVAGAFSGKRKYGKSK